MAEKEKKKDLSPMMQHYISVKEAHKDCVVFYRLGDFYEMFFDDAVKVSEMLDLTLTGRDCGLDERAPMCGIPYHAADLYISKLVSMGEKVAICEQLTEPQKGNKLVERDVIKIVTAGTFTNDELIDDKSNNFLASVYLTDGRAAIAWADITTGEFSVKSFDGDNYLSETADTLIRIAPSEIIANSYAEKTFSSIPMIENSTLPKLREYLNSEYEINNAENALKAQFCVGTLDSFAFEDPSSICASGALISYLKETQKHSLLNIKDLKIEKSGEFMVLDATAVKNLELIKTIKDGKRYGSLLWLLDKTKTGMGARKLQSWILTPLINKAKIKNRLDAVNVFFNNNLLRQSLSDVLRSVRDVGRITGKISNGNLTPKDCLSLAYSLENIPAIKFQLAGNEFIEIKNIVNGLKDFGDMVSVIKAAISDDVGYDDNGRNKSGIINKGFNEELDRYKNLMEHGAESIRKIADTEREKTGIKNLKIGYNKVFGYYFEVTNSFKDLVPVYFIRKQTIANAERYFTEELKTLENEIYLSEEKVKSLESAIFSQIKDMLAENTADLIKTADALSTLDVFLSLATVAKENDYVMPEICDFGESLLLKQSRHPVVEKITGQRFVPNDVLLDNSDNRTIILTGPNMAGKSTYMRQIALITIMAHIGSFVPASAASIPLTDKIFTRIGASDNLISNQSTFMVEMTEVASIVRNATKNSLLILDEIGRGTSTFDGLSIAWAVLEYVNDKIGAKTLFATHYHELIDLENTMRGVKNYKVAVKEMANGIVFVRKIMRGGTNKSFGIEVAELAGVDRTLTDRAKQILSSLEQTGFTTKTYVNEEEPIKKSEVESIISELDVNNLSPMQAFNVLIDLYEKVKG